MIRVYIGGTFDPVHLGHVTMARMIATSLNQHNGKYKIFFLPTAGSPFKSNTLSSQHRINMLKRVCYQSSFNIDNRELMKTPPVFSIDTFAEIRKQYPKDTVIFAMGLDSFLSLPKWKQIKDITDLCHLWVFNREEPIKEKQLNHSSENDINQILNSLQFNVSKNLQSLVTSSNGYVFFDKRTPPAISSSHIRHLIANNCHTNDIKNLLSNEVWEYIKTNKLYFT